MAHGASMAPFWWYHSEMLSTQSMMIWMTGYSASPYPPLVVVAPSPMLKTEYLQVIGWYHSVSNMFFFPPYDLEVIRIHIFCVDTATQDAAQQPILLEGHLPIGTRCLFMSFLHIKLQEIASNGTHKVFWVLGSSLLILPLESHKFFASALWYSNFSIEKTWKPI